MKKYLSILLTILISSISNAQVFPFPGGWADHTGGGGGGGGGSAPTIRAVGTCAGNPSAASIAGMPAGTVAGDLLIFLIETANQTTTPSWAGWNAVPSSFQGTGTAGGAAATRLSVFWGISDGTETALVDDSGDHQCGCIIGITAGTFNAVTPIDVSDGNTQAATTSISIPGVNATTKDNDLILAMNAGALPDAVTSTEYSGFTNANLTSVTEVVDATCAASNGGALGAMSGVKATAGVYGSSTAAAVTSAARGNISIAISPP